MIYIAGTKRLETLLGQVNRQIQIVMSNKKNKEEEMETHLSSHKGQGDAQYLASYGMWLHMEGEAASTPMPEHPHAISRYVPKPKSGNGRRRPGASSDRWNNPTNKGRKKNGN